MCLFLKLDTVRSPLRNILVREISRMGKFLLLTFHICACRARDYSAPVNFISAGLKKGAAEEAELEDSDDEEKPAPQEDFPKDFGPKKLKTVESYVRLLIQMTSFRGPREPNIPHSKAAQWYQSCGFLLSSVFLCGSLSWLASWIEF